MRKRTKRERNIALAERRRKRELKKRRGRGMLTIDQKLKQAANTVKPAK